MSTLNELRDEAFFNAKEKGFHDTPFIEWFPCSIANRHGEISEMWEAYRAGKLNSPCDKSDKMLALGLPVLTCAEEELIDDIIRALDTAGRLGIDLDRAYKAKMAYNKTREHMHGKIN